MSTTRKIEVSLLALAWAGVVTAFIGVLSTPRAHCDELPTPRGELAVGVGLVVALIATLVPVSIESFRGSGVRSTVAWLGIGVLTFAAILAVGVLETHRTASWGCG